MSVRKLILGYSIMIVGLWVGTTTLLWLKESLHSLSPPTLFDSFKSQYEFLLSLRVW